MDEDIQDIIQRLKVIIENRGNKPLDVLGGYIVGTTLVRDDWEEKYAPEPAIKEELERQIKAYEKNCGSKEKN